MQSEFNQGAAHARDLIIANIIGMQSEIGHEAGNPKYDVLQELLVHIEETYGEMMAPFKG